MKCTVLKDSPVPFFIRPVTNGIVNKITSMFLKPNFETNYGFLESQLETSPDGGQYLCGKDLTAADLMMSFALEAGQLYSGMSKEQYPRVWEYFNRLRNLESYKSANRKIEEIDGSFKTKL